MVGKSNLNAKVASSGFYDLSCRQQWDLWFENPANKDKKTKRMRSCETVDAQGKGHGIAHYEKRGEWS